MLSHDFRVQVFILSGAGVLGKLNLLLKSARFLSPRNICTPKCYMHDKTCYWMSATTPGVFETGVLNVKFNTLRNEVA